MNKFDFKKEYKIFYTASSKEVEIVDVPELSYLMADGFGNPNGSELFASIVQALYSLSYTMKFSLKKENKTPDFSVPPLQGLWWMGNNDYFDADKKDEWKWTLMIAQPPFITESMIDETREILKDKKDLDTSNIRFEKYKEGLSVQLLHIGAYSDETANIQKMHAFMKEKGYTFNGKHHEIYLSNPQRTAPEKLKTVLRQPIKKL